MYGANTRTHVQCIVVKHEVNACRTHLVDLLLFASAASSSCLTLACCRCRPALLHQALCCCILPVVAIQRLLCCLQELPVDVQPALLDGAAQLAARCWRIVSVDA